MLHEVAQRIRGRRAHVELETIEGKLIELQRARVDVDDEGYALFVDDNGVHYSTRRGVALRRFR